MRPDLGLKYPYRGIHPELDDHERAARAYQYATKHDTTDLPEIRRRLDEAESTIRVLTAIVHKLAGHRTVITE